MEAYSTSDSSRQVRWQATRYGYAWDCQRNSVCRTGWRTLAYAAQRIWAMADGLRIFSQIPTRRSLAADSSDPIQEGTPQGRQEANAKCSDYRQSERQNDRKRGLRGYDAGKKILGRKRHIVVDTLGLILAVVVYAGKLQDRDGALLVLERIRGYVPRLRLIWADGGYAGNSVETVKALFHWTLEIVKRPDTGFVVLPKRWIVERTFSWLYRYRRLSKDYEQLPENSEAMILIAMINLMSCRIHIHRFNWRELFHQGFALQNLGIFRF